MNPSHPFATGRMLLATLCTLALMPLSAHADPRGDFGHEHHFRDGPPGRGAVVTRLPRAHRTVVHGGMPYYFDGGFWYRPWGSRFVVVAPPIGIAVPVLPHGFVTLRLAGREYYRQDDVYYMRRDGGYIVVAPPAPDALQDDSKHRSTTVSRGELFIYPNRGQDERQQRNDRFECHEWAVEQTGYDPTMAGGSGDGAYSQAHRSDYQRAMSACLEGRGYTVR